MLTIEQAREAVNLAMRIEAGTIDHLLVLDVLRSNPKLANELAYFWMTFNAMTRNALQALVLTKCKLHLEKCWELNGD